MNKTNTTQKRDNNKNATSTIVTEVAGAVAIAGAAVAATMALKDKKTRERVKQVMTDVRDQAIDYIETLKTESNTGEAAHTVKKIAADTKKVVEKANKRSPEN